MSDFSPLSQRPSKEAPKEKESETPIDVENDSDATVSDANHSEEENIEEIPDSQRRIMLHKQRPAGHLLKEMRMHKIKYEALDKLDETFPCYSALCREGGRSSCYSPSCILKERTRVKLINSVNNYKIITCKPAPFDNVGSCSPIRLSDADSVPDKAATTPGGIVNGTPPSFALDSPRPKGKDKTPANTELKLSFDDDSNSQSSTSDPKGASAKVERVFSAPNCAGKIYLKKSSLEAKKPKKHKIPPAHFFIVRRALFPKVKKEEEEEDPPSTPPQPVRSLFVLPAWELRMMCRKGWRYSPAGFSQNAKINHHFWPYPCPRPVFRLTWLFRTTLITTVNSAALQLRILWACLRWDDMQEKGPLDGRKQITSDSEIIQTEILKRKVSGRFYEKTEYLKRIVTIPLDMPKPVRGQCLEFWILRLRMPLWAY